LNCGAKILRKKFDRSLLGNNFELKHKLMEEKKYEGDKLLLNWFPEYTHGITGS